MLTRTLKCFALSLLAAGNAVGSTEPQFANKGPERPSGTLERMIIARGTVAMELDVNRIKAAGSTTHEPDRKSFRFEVRPNSVFAIRVFNQVLRGAETGSMELVAENSQILPNPLNASANQLFFERSHSSNPFDLVFRDSGTIFFNVEGNVYEYDAGYFEFQGADY
jgi:hypothetical protein